MNGAFEDSGSGPFAECKLPIDFAVVDGPHARSAVRRQVASTLLSACERLRQRRAELPKGCHVVAFVTLPGLFASRLVVFYDRAYYEGFFQRQGPYQWWDPAAETASLVRRWSLPTLPEKGFRTRDIGNGPDETAEIRGEVWCYGDLEGTVT